MKKALIVGNASNYFIFLMKEQGYEIVYYEDCPENILGLEFDIIWIDEEIRNEKSL
jgi:hypothetical protein